MIRGSCASDTKDNRARRRLPLSPSTFELTSGLRHTFSERRAGSRNARSDAREKKKRAVGFDRIEGHFVHRERKLARSRENRATNYHRAFAYTVTWWKSSSAVFANLPTTTYRVTLTLIIAFSGLAPPFVANSGAPVIIETPVDFNGFSRYTPDITYSVSGFVAAVKSDR